MALAQAVPPKTARREVKDTYFGQTISDSYRWMENLKADETQKWIKAQADYSRAYLDKLPMRDDILKRLDELSDVGTRVNGIQRRGNMYFYNRRASNENDFRLYVREGLTGAERLLVDPDKIVNDGKRRSIGDFSLSQDGRYLSYISSVGGNEIGELRVIETATGKDAGEVIDRIQLTHGINDPRVEPWMSAKMAARLQEATSSRKPVLLRIDYDAGHGRGTSKKQLNEQNADIYAFLFEQLGGANR